MEPPVSFRYANHDTRASAARLGLRLKKELRALAVVVVIPEMHRLNDGAPGNLRGEVRIGKRFQVAVLDGPALDGGESITREKWRQMKPIRIRSAASPNQIRIAAFAKRKSGARARERIVGAAASFNRRCGPLQSPNLGDSINHHHLLFSNERGGVFGYNRRPVLRRQAQRHTNRRCAEPTRATKERD
jgi:hypothetical protein